METELLLKKLEGVQTIDSASNILKISKDKAVYYFNSASNENLKECSGTDYQVAVGVYAALFTLLFSSLKPGIHYTENLLDTIFPKFLTDNLMIQEFVFEKQGKRLKQISHDPHISYGEGEFIKM